MYTEITDTEINDCNGKALLVLPSNTQLKDSSQVKRISFNDHVLLSQSLDIGNGLVIPYQAPRPASTSV